MGCGSSKLNGEKTDTNEPAPQPIKKVATNFSTVDYDAGASGRRDTIVGPYDTPRQKSELPPVTEKRESTVAPEIAGDSSTTATATNTSTGGDRLEYENKLPSSTAPERIQDDAEYKPAYQDVTARPTTPNGTHFLDEALPSSVAPPSERLVQ